MGGWVRYVSVDDSFEADWKEEVASTLKTFGTSSEVREDYSLDRQIDKGRYSIWEYCMRDKLGSGQIEVAWTMCSR